MGTVVPSVGDCADGAGWDGTVVGSASVGPWSSIAQPEAIENSNDIKITAMTVFLISAPPGSEFWCHYSPFPPIFQGFGASQYFCKFLKKLLDNWPSCRYNKRVLFEPPV